MGSRKSLSGRTGQRGRIAARSHDRRVPEGAAAGDASACDPHDHSGLHSSRTGWCDSMPIASCEYDVTAAYVFEMERLSARGRLREVAAQQQWGGVAKRVRQESARL